jgi:hypothetical protein
LPSDYFFFAGTSFCFNHNRIASATALLSAPLSPPYTWATLTLNSVSTSSGTMTSSLPITTLLRYSVFVSLRLYWAYCVITELRSYVSISGTEMAGSRVSFDAEVVELRLPEDQRIQVRTAEDLTSIARKLCKPILHEVVDGHPYPAGSRAIGNGSQILAVYDGPWVFYCKLKADQEDRQASHL